ncbi:MAG: DNA adenine methylase [Alphaproteobacteria bacterium]|nr:DNA adenine methylase [Alphaproteobacteria bacterium]
MLKMALQTVIPPTSLSAEALARRLLNEGRMEDGRPPLYLRKAHFLDRLRSTGKLDYKRYLTSPLRYAGGKSLAVGMVVNLMPDAIERVASPFMGGGSVEIAIARELGLPVAAYDVFDILCTYWQEQLQRPSALARRLRAFAPDRPTFARVKTRLEGHWKRGETLNRYDLAAHYYFNSNTSYGPHFLGWPSDIYLSQDRYAKMVEKVEAFSAPGLTVRCMGFERSIPRHAADFLYCDPPYYLEEGKTFVGMYPHRNFPIHHAGFRHEALRDLLLKHKAGFILSYNDCPTIREWYSDCNIETPEWQYTFGQGDTRIGENRRERNGGSHVKKSHELLIWRHPR